MSMLNNIPSFPEKHHFKGIKNWIFFKSYFISTVWSKGLSGYLNSSIFPPAKSTTSTAPLPGPMVPSAPTTAIHIYSISLSFEE